MKKVISYVKTALHFGKMKAGELAPFAGSILLNATADPGVTIDADDLTALAEEKAALVATAELRLTNKSMSLTTLEGTQATAVLVRVTNIASSVEKQANAIEPGNTARATLAIQRIGFMPEKVADIAGRFFAVFKTAVGAASIRVKKDKLVNLYHWRWSTDGINWVRLPDSTAVSVYIYNLPHNKIVFFQSAVTLKARGVPQFDANNNEPEWGDSITALIP